MPKGSMSPALAQHSAAAGLLTYEQAAACLSVSERQVRFLYEKRKLTAVKVGRFVRFRQQDLDRFIESHLVEAVR